MLDQDIRIVNLSRDVFHTYYFYHDNEIVGGLEYFDNISIEDFAKQFHAIDQLLNSIALNKDKAIFVLAAGNDRLDISWMPDAPNILSISSIDPLLHLSKFSNYGSRIDFTAPADSWIRVLEHQKFGGTSAATPVISGIIYNILKINPNLRFRQIMNLLKATAFDLGEDGYDEFYGWGMPNLILAAQGARYHKEGKLKILNKDLDMPKLSLLKKNTQELNANSKYLIPLTYDQLLKKSTSCTEYKEGVNQLFLNYFSTEQPKELCQFYKRHGVILSALTYCEDKDFFLNDLKNIFENQSGLSKEYFLVGTALGKHSEKGLSYLIDDFKKQENIWVDIGIGFVLLKLEDISVEKLLPLLKAKEKFIRFNTALLLGELRGKKNKQSAIEQLILTYDSDNDIEVKARILQSLGYLYAEKSLPLMIKALSAPEEDIKIAAASAIGWLNSATKDLVIKHVETAQGKFKEKLLDTIKTLERREQSKILKKKVDEIIGR